MIELMLAILAAWFVSLFAGPAIYAAMGLAGFAFLAIAGIPGIVIPQMLALVAWSSMHGAAMLYLDGLVQWAGLEAEPEALARALSTQVFAGLRP